MSHTYTCTHPDCVRKASEKSEQWRRVHSKSTKKGQSHWPWRVGGERDPQVCNLALPGFDGEQNMAKLEQFVEAIPGYYFVVAAFSSKKKHLISANALSADNPYPKSACGNRARGNSNGGGWIVLNPNEGWAQELEMCAKCQPTYARVMEDQQRLVDVKKGTVPAIPLDHWWVTPDEGAEPPLHQGPKNTWTLEVTLDIPPMDIPDIGEIHPDDLIFKPPLSTLTCKLTDDTGAVHPLDIAMAMRIEQIMRVAQQRRLTDNELKLLSTIRDDQGREVPMGSPEWFEGMLEDDTRRVVTEALTDLERDIELWGAGDEPGDYEDDCWGDSWEIEQELQYPPEEPPGYFDFFEPDDCDYEGLGFDPCSGQEIDDEPDDIFDDYSDEF